MTFRRAMLLALAALAPACADAPRNVVRAPERGPVASPAAPREARRTPTLPPLPPDVAPESLGDAKSSAAARPWWGEGVAGYAPQTDAIRELAAAASGAPAPTGALRGAMLVCTVAVTYGETKLLDLTGLVGSHAAADLRVRFGANESAHVGAESFFLASEGDSGVIEAEGPEDSNRMSFTVPLASLEPGAPFVVVVSDRETVTPDNDIATLRATYDGKTPIVVANDHARAECGVAPRAAIEAALVPRLAALDRAIAEMDLTYHLDPDDDLFQGRLTVTHVTPPFVHAAALVGWDDPRVVARMKRMELLEARFDAEAVAYAKERYAGLPPQGTWQEIRALQIALRANGIVCDAAGKEPYRKALGEEIPGCVVRVAVKNLKTAPAALGAAQSEVQGYADLTLVDGAGRRRSVRYVGSEDGGTIAPPDWGKEDPPVAPGGERALLFELAAEDENLHPYFGPKPPPIAGDAKSLEPIVLDVLCRRMGWDLPAQLVHLRVAP